MKVQDLVGQYHYGMRALGAISGTYHTNTLEGYRHWGSKGIRFWETDVAVSADGRYVMIGHFLDRETMRRMEITDLPDELTHDWYMRQKLFPRSTKGLTPLSLEDIVRFALDEPEQCFMLDMYPFSLGDSLQKTTDFLRCLTDCVGIHAELYDRIIVEAYNQEMLQALHAFSQIRNIQLSVSHFMENEGVRDIRAFVDFARENGVTVISYEWRYAREHIDHLEVLRDCGFLFVSRSVTNCFENGKKKKYGVNIALLDYYVTKPTDLFALARLFVSRIQQKHG